MAQTVLQQVLILAAMMMLGFLLGKLGKVERKGADLLSMLLLDVFFPCNILAAASGDFGDMPFSQVIKIALAYMSCFILFTLLPSPIAKLLRLNEDDSLVFTRSVAYPNNGFVGIPLCTAVFGTEGTVLGSLSVPCATLYMFLFIMQSFRREKDHNLKQQLKSMLTPMNISAVLMIIMLATGWKFTGAPLQFLSSMANCVVPTSMLIIGCLLSGSPLIDVLKKAHFVPHHASALPCHGRSSRRCPALYRLEPHGVPVHRNGAWVQRGRRSSVSSACAMTARPRWRARACCNRICCCRSRCR